MPVSYSLSVIVPAFNEAENVGALHEQVAAVMNDLDPPEWEIIFVNDGSSDRTEAILDELSRESPHVRALHFVTNQGQTAAMDAGIRNAKGDLLITMDADLQNDPADIPKLLASIDDGYDCACGVRVNRRDSWLRLVSSRIANRVRNKLSNETISDTGCSLKVFRAQALARVKLFEGMHRFLPTLVKMEGYRVVEVPVSHRPRQAGESKYGVWNRVFKSFRDLLAVRWMKNRMLRYEIREPGDRKT